VDQGFPWVLGVVTSIQATKQLVKQLQLKIHIKCMSSMVTATVLKDQTLTCLIWLNQF
jgi:hypothetical protein